MKGIIILGLVIICRGSKGIQRRRWHPSPVLLPGKCHGRRSLVGCSPWGRKELDTTEQLHFHFSLSCIGKGNGNPLQCSCLENPRDGGAWWAAVYGVAQSWTRLKGLSSSSTPLPDSSFWQISLEFVVVGGSGEARWRRRRAAVGAPLWTLGRCTQGSPPSGGCK